MQHVRPYAFFWDKFGMEAWEKLKLLVTRVGIIVRTSMKHVAVYDQGTKLVKHDDGNGVSIIYYQGNMAN